MMTVFREFDAEMRLELEFVDNGDGTGVRTTYDADGTVTSVEQLTGLPIPVEPEPTAEERLATLIAALTDAQSLEEIRDAAAAAGGTP